VSADSIIADQKRGRQAETCLPIASDLQDLNI
jgi:hypothetical protein